MHRVDIKIETDTNQDNRIETNIYWYCNRYMNIIRELVGINIFIKATNISWFSHTLLITNMIIKPAN